MRIAAWNIGNRAGAVPFRPAVADAALALDADALFFLGYFPREHGRAFEARLAARGYTTQITSPESREVADRVLFAARVAAVADPLPWPRSDPQFSSSLLAVRFPAAGLRALGVRVPGYPPRQHARARQAWDWLEHTAARWRAEPAVIVGDLNGSLATPRQRGGDHLRRIVESGWQLATPAEGASRFGLHDRGSVVDHLLAAPAVAVAEARFVTAAAGIRLAGSRGALSDHAALVAEVAIRRG